MIKIGPQAVPSLVEAFKNKKDDKDFRRRAAEILGEIGLGAVPALIKALEAPDSDVRWDAAYALADIAPEAKTAAVLSLIEVLKDDRKWVCEYAAWLLDTLNTPEARKALEEYKKI